MASARSLSIDGVRMWFWSHDHHPPHFHAACADGSWEVTVQLLLEGPDVFGPLRPGNARMLRRHRIAIMEGVDRCREALLLEWEAVHGAIDP